MGNPFSDFTLVVITCCDQVFLGSPFQALVAYVDDEFLCFCWTSCPAVEYPRAEIARRYETYRSVWNIFSYFRKEKVLERFLAYDARKSVVSVFEGLADHMRIPLVGSQHLPDLTG